MIETKKFLQSATGRSLPASIREHPVFVNRNLSTIKKVFPHFGLNNCIADCDHPTIKNAKIVFTSDGLTGLWDLATMSMRGATSCMHWSNHHHSHLVGSIVDPCCGIVYITDGSITERGLAIKERSLVRLLINEDKIFICTAESTYKDTGNKDPYNYKDRNVDYHITEKVIVNFLKTKSTIPVLSYSELYKKSLWYGTCVPKARILSSLSGRDLSLIDGSIPYTGTYTKSVGDLIN